jgi:hypothetical protein
MINTIIGRVKVFESYVCYKLRAISIKAHAASFVYVKIGHECLKEHYAGGISEEGVQKSCLSVS